MQKNTLMIKHPSIMTCTKYDRTFGSQSQQIDIFREMNKNLPNVLRG